jgi:hypothetical protein
MVLNSEQNTVKGMFHSSDFISMGDMVLNSEQNTMKGILHLFSK